MAKIEVTFEEIFSFVRPKLPPEITGLRAESGRVRFVFKKIIKVPVSAMFIRYEKPKLYFSVNIDSSLFSLDQFSDFILKKVVPLFKRDIGEGLRLTAAGIEVDLRKLLPEMTEVKDVAVVGDLLIVEAGFCQANDN